MNDLTDAELLLRYARDGSNLAFEVLVRRHIDAVFTIAQRQVGGDAHLAQDVAQLVFTAAARKAGSLAGRPLLGGWLYRTTQFVARDVVRAERRRRGREEQAFLMESVERDTVSAADPDQLRRRLGDALAGLNDTDRDAIWLRFMESKSFAQIGAVLRLNENAARMRVDRALEKVRKVLRKRGITSSALVLGELLAEQAAGCAPAGLAAAVSRGVGASGTAGAASAIVHFMTSTKLAVLIASGLAALAGVGFLAERHSNAEIRAADAALRAELSAAASSATQSARLQVALKESDAELGKLLDAVARMPATSQAGAATVKSSGPKITVIGAVKQPGLVSLADGQELGLTEALSLVGGLNGTADARVVVNHRNPDNGTIDKQMFDVRQIKRGKMVEPKLQADDFIVVFERTI